MPGFWATCIAAARASSLARPVTRLSKVKPGLRRERSRSLPLLPADGRTMSAGVVGRRAVADGDHRGVVGGCGLRCRVGQAEPDRQRLGEILQPQCFDTRQIALADPLQNEPVRRDQRQRIVVALTDAQTLDPGLILLCGEFLFEAAEADFPKLLHHGLRGRRVDVVRLRDSVAGCVLTQDLMRVDRCVIGGAGSEQLYVLFLGDRF